MAYKKPSPDLLGRWAAPITRTLLQTLQEGRSYSLKSPFGLVDGLEDFRGFPFEAALKIVGKRFEHADLSAASLEGLWLQECVFRSVKLDHARVADIKDHGNAFEGCSFIRTSFAGAGLGYRQTLFSECLFQESNFRKARFTAARFRSCRFLNAKLHGVDFYASSFDECAFAGRLEHVWFRAGYPSATDVAEFGEAEPNLMRRVSFAEAELVGVNFTGGCDLSSVTLPTRGDYRLYRRWRERLLRLSEASLQWSTPEQREVRVFVKSYLEAAEKQSWMALNVSEISGEFGMTLARKMFECLDSSPS